jgi:hypothetical protein
MRLMDGYEEGDGGIKFSMNIELNIEELVLHGFSHGDKHRIAQAVQQELTRLFSEGLASHALLQSGEYYRVDGGQFEVQADAKPERIGTQIANAVCGGLQK